MLEKKTNLPPFTVAGKKIRTNNKIEFTENRIHHFWADFQKNNTLNKIESKQQPVDLYCFYYDYESDMNGEYSVLLGAKVESTTKQNPGIEILQIPTQNYVIFTANSIKEIRSTWQEIWSTKLNRMYGYDFEKYESDSNQIKIYISIK